jgi:hypothetical protein
MQAWQSRMTDLSAHIAPRAIGSSTWVPPSVIFKLNAPGTLPVSIPSMLT